MNIFRLTTKLQLFVYNNGITFKISKLIIGHIQRFVLGRKVTLQTLCTYNHHLQTLFMKRHPGTDCKKIVTMAFTGGSENLHTLAGIFSLDIL